MRRNYYSHYEPVPVEADIQTVEQNKLSGFFGNIFSKFAIDDLILIAVIFVLITDEQPDMITIFALIYIFLV